MNAAEPIHSDAFYHDGRGPELQRVIWKYRKQILVGFEYYNPDDPYDAEHLRHLVLEKVEAYAMAGEEVHGDILATGKTKAAIFRICDSSWKKSFNQMHLSDCEHFQIMFYDEIFDVICKSITAGKGSLQTEDAQQKAARDSASGTPEP